MNSATLLLRSLVLSLCAAAPAVAFAQEAPPAGGGPEAPAAPAPGVTVVQVPGGYPGSLPPAGWSPDGHLPSSARSVSDISRSSDGFDNRQGRSGPATARGSANGQYVSEGAFVPEAHTVRRGDTLWDLSSRYYQNPYQWPRVWSYNPQIQNPHWIYPGDHVRLREQGGVAASASRIGMRGRRGVPSGTVFLRDIGWVDDRTEDIWGEIVGSPSDRMMLSEGDDIYVQLDRDHEVSLGEQLTIFRPIRTVASEKAKGTLVSIRGTAKIERYNPKTKMARAKIIEAIDVIERGVKIGPVGRKFDVVPPVASDRDLDATIICALYPYHFYGQHQVVFLDRGEKDGVRPGMRFFAVMRGDRWQNNIKSAGVMAVKRPRVEDDHPAQVDTLPTGLVDDDLLPDETFAELRVMRVREHTATALVVASRHEVERNVRLVARKGF
jgi:hypothetical protein